MDGSIGSEKEHLGIVIVAIACPRFLPQISPQNTLRPLPCKGIFRAILLDSSAAGGQRSPRAQSEEISKSLAKVEERAKRGHNCALVSVFAITATFRKGVGLLDIDLMSVSALKDLPLIEDERLCQRRGPKKTPLPNN